METLEHREEEALREHDDQKRRHEETIMEHERHPENNKAYHEMKEAKEVEDAEIGYHEKGERRQQDVNMSELKEEINTDLRDGEGV